MSEFRHILNGTVINEPIDWTSFTGEISRDAKSRTILPAYPSSANFGADGYGILRALFVSALCDIVDYQVDERCGTAWRTALRCKIIIADCVFNLTKCQVKASLVDDSIGARITNNRKIPIRYTSELTKNEDNLNPTPVIQVSIFDPADTDPNAYLTPNRRMADWFAAITHAVRYITDDNVSVVSDWYANLPDNERWAITTGYQLRTADTQPRGLYMTWSFDELFTELAIKYDLWIFATRDANGDPVINIEPMSALMGSGLAMEHEAVEDLEQDIDTDQLYASVAVGSETGIANLDAVESLPFLVLIGQSEERFHFTGVCNTDQELDLVNKWSICTNLIERTLGGNAEQDDKLFFVQYDRTTLDATKGNDFDPSFQYNPALMNFRVLERYLLPSSISVATTDPDTLNGKVERPLPAPVPQGNIFTPTGAATFFLLGAELDYTVVISDPGGNFQLSPGRYTAPVQGFYSFTFKHVARFTKLTATPASVMPVVRFRRYNSANVLWQTFDVDAFPQPILITALGLNGPWNCVAILGLVLDPGDYITVQLGWRISGPTSVTVGVEIMPPSWSLETTGNPGGGTINVDPLVAPIVRYGWSRNITAEQWAAINDDPRLAISVGPYISDQRIGHLQKISRTMSSGEGTLTILTDRTRPL
jgi:hypothetical protein